MVELSKNVRQYDTDETNETFYSVNFSLSRSFATIKCLIIFVCVLLLFQQCQDGLRLSNASH